MKREGLIRAGLTASSVCGGTMQPFPFQNNRASCPTSDLCHWQYVSPKGRHMQNNKKRETERLGDRNTQREQKRGRNPERENLASQPPPDRSKMIPCLGPYSVCALAFTIQFLVFYPSVSGSWEAVAVQSVFESQFKAERTCLLVPAVKREEESSSK